MAVLEVSPGGGWYTAILAPYLASKGHLSITNFDPEGPADSPLTNFGKRLKARLDADKATFGQVTVHTQAGQGAWNLGPDASYDLVLTFRNIHNWLPDGDKAFFVAAFKALKPGGTLGVVEHRAKPGTDVPTSQKTGYVDEAYVIARAQEAGFRLLAKSEINANAKDSKDHPEGVWTLPPVMRLGDKDRAKYEAIGESDRMTLKFVKP
jgi:predicted methyltransferase